jgi:ubiquitin carboxyl-terminal hydrolase 14
MEQEIGAKASKLEEDFKKATEETGTTSNDQTVFKSVEEANESNDMEVEEEDAEDLAKALALSVSSSSSSSSSEPTYFERFGLPAHFTGQYECHSVVTHKGMDADSGHYIGWVRQKPESDFWWRYDDK